MDERTHAPAPSHTHRDTFAFVLAILGASLWAVVPTATLLQEKGIGPEIGLPMVFAAGGLLGAWSGRTVWRHVAWPTPVIAAALVAAIVLAARRENVPHAATVGLRELACVVLAAAGGVVGALFGSRARTAQRALVAAWIAISGPALVILGGAAIHAFGYRLNGAVAGWSALLSVAPMSLVAMHLCGGVRPNAFGAWLFGLLLAALLMSVAGSDTMGAPRGFLFSVILAAIVTWIASIPVRLIDRRRPAPTDLPAAHVVARR